MWVKMYKKDFFSKITVIILVLLVLISVISFSFSLAEKNEFRALLGDTSPDLNQEALIHFLDGYTGIRFLFNYWFNSAGLFAIGLITLYAWSGAFLSPRLQNEKDNGFGNLTMTRIPFKKRLNQMLLSQSFYIMSIVLISNLISLLLALIFGGMPTRGVLTEMSAGYELTRFQVFLVIFIQNIWISLLVIFVNGITLLSNVWIKNKYLIQALPIFLFVFLPYLLGTVLGNLIPATSRLISPFFPEFLVTAINDTFNAHFDMLLTLRSFAPLFVFAFLFFILYYLNISAHSRNYL